MATLGELLEDIRPTDTHFFEWLTARECGTTITDSRLHIERENGILYIRDYREAKENYDQAPVFIIAGIAVVRLIREIQRIKEQYNRPGDIIIIHENGQYFVKPATINALSFIKDQKGNYYSSSFWSYNKLGALVRFLFLNDFSFLESWINSGSKKIEFPEGYLTKNNKKITLHFYYNNARLELLTHSIDISTLQSVIKKYQELISLQPEELLLIHEPTYYSFMINPYEEIKIPINE
jgi:hypothetical protein